VTSPSPTPRSDRSARRKQRTESPILKTPFRLLRNPFPPLEVISPEQLLQLHEASMKILEEIGIDFMDTEALSIWEKAGAKVDHAKQHVWFDRNLILEAVSHAPATFKWHARNPAKSLIIGQDYITFNANGGVAYSTNLDTGRRRGTMEDYLNYTKLVQMCNVIHYGGEQLVAPQDIPSSLRHLKRLYTLFTLTDKVAMEAAHGREIVSDNVEMAKIMFGDLEQYDGPVIGGIVNASSPLRYDQRMLGGIINYARAKQTLVITPFILAGAMSPISIASAMAQQNAEALVGIAFAQLVRPGTPVLYGGFTTNVDMKSGSPAFGTPEGAWAMSVGAQLARHYQLPYRGSGSLNTAKVPDAQATWETMWTIWPAVMSHTNFIMHSTGWLEGGLTASYEKFIMDVENLSMFYHFFKGFEISPETLALDMIEEVGPGGHHFGTSHTQARFATEFYESALADRLGYESWVANGEQDAVKRAYHVWKDLIANYEQPLLDPGIEQGLREYVERRSLELEGKSLYDSV
jgi:trimethylamine---corrinoid protein Co-methyltransferase